jgi:excisionase family DNA binding protein
MAVARATERRVTATPAADSLARSETGSPARALRTVDPVPEHQADVVPIGTPLAAPVPRLALSVDETAACLGISRETVYVLIRSGQLCTRKAGTRTIIAVRAIEAYLAADQDAS